MKFASAGSVVGQLGVAADHAYARDDWKLR